MGAGEFARRGNESHPFVDKVRQSGFPQERRWWLLGAELSLPRSEGRGAHLKRQGPWKSIFRCSCCNPEMWLGGGGDDAGLDLSDEPTGKDGDKASRSQRPGAASGAGRVDCTEGWAVFLLVML